MKESLLRDLYKNRGYKEKDIDNAVGYVRDMETRLDVDNATVESIKEYIKELMAEGNNTAPVFLALARYFYLIDNHAVYIYFTKLFGGLGVMENIRKRLEFHTDGKTADGVFGDLESPPLGASPEDIPEFTEKVMKRLKSSLSPALYRKVLAGNNHGVPEEAMLDEKKFFEESADLETYLKERHARKVAELQLYCDEKKVWFEQEITQGVVDYVASNQEILSAVRNGNKLYVTKIPFDGINFLSNEDPVLKSYYACHCPFARERILDESKSNVDSDWCYCSGGFAKFPFEVIFGEELEVEMLDSALKGDPVCRFAITLPLGL
ncbi:MAG: hypothetical protein JXN10_10615 [Clostridia bacterium]|nr:hypothetical protein [Clostridia bacterium]MBN2883974.1 hypothetical protein [Clostridia bacterium]